MAAISREGYELFSRECLGNAHTPADSREGDGFSMDCVQYFCQPFLACN